MDEYYRAVMPEPVTLLGVTLRPFSLGHVLHLHRTQNAFVTGEPVTLMDLVCGVFICSQRYHEFERVMQTGIVEVKGRWRVRRVPLDDFMIEWQDRIGLFDTEQKAKEFNDYMDAGCAHPYIITKRGVAQRSAFENGCPFVQQVKAYLQHKMSINDAEIVDRSWSLCLWDFFTLLMLDGHVEIVDRDTTLSAIAAAQNFANRLQERINKGELRYQ